MHNHTDTQNQNTSQDAINQQHLQPNDQAHGQVQGHSHGQNHSIAGHHDDDYNPLKIPPDWNEAQQHGLSRIMGLKDGKLGRQQKVCKCCGYEVNRIPLTYKNNSPIDLKFLGSGFPCFYQWIKYSIGILLVLFLVSGVFNIYTSSLGDFCRNQDPLQLSSKKQDIDIKAEMEKCHDKLTHIFSLANKIGKVGEQYNPTQHKLNFATYVIVMLFLFKFRYSQRVLDAEIDSNQVSPSDFTIIVKNIPKNLEKDYIQELRHIFTYNACEGQVLEVTKVNLVYDIDYVIKLEDRLDIAVKNLQEFLNVQGFLYDDPTYIDLMEEIEHIEKRIHHIEESIPFNAQNYFTGIAFISFKSEKQKDDVLAQNPYSQWEQIQSFFHPKGNLPVINKEHVSWNGNKLFIDEAPEPEDIDWEFIHKSTTQKIKARAKAWFLTILFISLCFLVIYAVSESQSSMIETTYEQAEKGDVEIVYFTFVKIYSFLISMGIVLFNKFCLGFVFHKIVDMEFYSTKTKFNIAFAIKLTLALFCNTAVITYIAEILLNNNYYGPGGFINTESWVFFWNCLIPPLVWLIDPWTHQKDNWRKQAIGKSKINKCYLTQKEANKMMEQVEYTQGKRYADMMKTMWFTFLYGPCIPVGILCSLTSLIFYYNIDFYNVAQRRTIKEVLSKEVSIEMIELLEWTLFFFSIGNFTFYYQLFGEIDFFLSVQALFSIVYLILPMQYFNEKLFKVNSDHANTEYVNAKFEFQNDYDRLNPITKKAAMKDYQQQMLHHYEQNQTQGNPHNNQEIEKIQSMVPEFQNY